jgi:hypothetical protein
MYFISTYKRDYTEAIENAFSWRWGVCSEDRFNGLHCAEHTGLFLGLVSVTAKLGKNLVFLYV